MALVNGFYNGEPAEIPDNFVQLWPDIYSLTPPAGEPESNAPAGATETAASKPQGGRK